jgi:GNAT superfamily N-acetyltransferase
LPVAAAHVVVKGHPARMVEQAGPVRPATRADHDRLVEVLAGAFADDPVFRYMLPPALRRRSARLRGFFRLEVPRSRRRGGAWTSADGAGAAIWYPPGHWRPSSWEALRQTPAAVRVFGGQLGLASQAQATMQAHHPHEPHWYLSYLAAVPGRQRTGIGSALLRPVLRRCDEHGSPAYLEATSERNRALYTRHGFVEREPYALPDGPPLFPMWREPRGGPRDGQGG